MPSLSERPSNYLSSRSADVILSDVRPTKLKLDALRCLNVLLDELLWRVLDATRSLATERLKAGLLKLLPTPLGKEAVLEAEIELRAYLERTSSPNTASNRDVSLEHDNDFPLQPVFELLRLKCEAYSTLNDSDEDAEAEAKWSSKLAQLPNFTPAKIAAIAPAALYLTAILESVCEHALSSIGRVAARDSSRTSATLQDLYVGLCEDETIYGLFKTMKVYDQIETLMKATPLRRSKSLSRQERNLSVTHVTPVLNDFQTSAAQARASSESANSNSHHSHQVPGPTSTLGTSVDKNKNKKVFGRLSGDREGSQSGGSDSGAHKRSGSALSDAQRRAISPYEEPVYGTEYDEVAAQEFDDLVRTGGTMKVSLTPDRLKTIEVYNKEKSLRLNRPPPSSAAAAIRSATSAKYTNDSSADTSASEEPTVENAPRQPSIKAPRVRHVDLIVEDDETAGSLNPTNEPPKRKIPEPLNTITSPPRSRSISSAAAPYPSPTSRPSVGRKSSLSAVSPPPSTSSISKHQFEPGAAPPNGFPPLEMNGQIKKKRGVGRNRESLDIDDIMNDFSDEEPAKKSPFTPKSARAIDTSTRDLLSFLNEGPPEGPPSLPQSVSSPRAKQGRFRTMVSRLTRGPSSEKLSVADSAYAARKGSVPALPVSLPPTLSSKKSLRDFSTAAKIVVPPRIPPMSPPASPSGENGNSLPRTRNTSTTRKAVPALERRLTSPDTDINRGVEVKYSDAKSAPVNGEFTFPSEVKQYRQPEYVRPPTTPRRTPAAVERKPVMTNGISAGNLGVETKPEEAATTVKPPSPDGRSSGTTKGRHSETTTASSAVERPSSQVTITGVSSEKRRSSKSSHQKDAEKAQIQKGADDKAAVTANSSVAATPEFGQHAAELRHLMSRASNADECRLLLDMFLIRMGIKYELLGPQITAVDEKTLVDPEQQSSVIEALLTNSDVSIVPFQPPTPPKELAVPIINGDSPTNHKHEPEIAETSMIPPVTPQPQLVAAA